MKMNCKFIGWSTEGKSLIYNGVDLMSQINLSHEIIDENQYYGFYPVNIPKQEYVGKKIRLIPIKYNQLDEIIAYIEFSMCYYLFYKI